jgi:UTP--glucose-1-phosphate uridylyltransferase
LQRTLEERGKTAALDAIKSWLPLPGQVASVRQQLPMGLGHAVLCAKNLIGDEPFAVILPDDLVLSETPCMKQLVDVHEETGGNVVAVVDVPREDTKKYGILDVSSDDGRLASVRGLVEKPDPAEAPSTLSIIGRYVLTPSIFGHLEKTGKGAGGEIQLTDGMVKLLGAEPFHGLRFEGQRYDCGDKVGFIEANIAFGLARADVSADLRRIIAKLVS